MFVVRNLALQSPDALALMVIQGDCQCKPAIQAVRRAGNSGVISADRHLDPVEHLFVKFTVADQAGGRLVHAQVHRRDIVGGTDDQIGLGDTAIIISGVIVD